jgi:lipopolysaccharide/colanic/teichoic acid biosynthesis glycosyltransferase
MGKLIRATSIDELPQFFNILLGDMSLIGNRPYMVSEGSHMGKQKKTILSVKPGLTGWWQVCGRNNLTFGQRLVLEAEYGEKASLGFDLKILIRTFKVVLKKVGSKQ